GGRVFQRLAGDVRDRFAVVGFVLDQSFPSEQTQYTWAWVQRRVCLHLRARKFTFGQQAEIQQAVGVIKSRPEQLPARHVLERRGQATVELHVRGVDGQTGAEARQRGAIGAQQEDR